MNLFLILSNGDFEIVVYQFNILSNNSFVRYYVTLHLEELNAVVSLVVITLDDNLFNSAAIFWVCVYCIISKMLKEFVRLLLLLAVDFFFLMTLGAW